ncbi:MAG TPA: hypothetical protein VNC50_04180 [Planctomycetia bacterium]|nr:hypothetical protein [Planctomycetia bacterium]
MRRRVLGILSLAMLSSGVAAAADVVPLDAGNLSLVPSFRNWGVAPGDLLMKNAQVQAVVYGVNQRGESSRSGRLVLFPSGGAEPFGFVPGPVGDWSRGDIGASETGATVKFTRQGNDWSAELEYSLAENAGWVDVTTRIRNTGKRTLEIPVVDGVRTPENAKLAAEQPAPLFGTAESPSLALLPLRGKVAADDSGKNDFFVGYISGDPTPGFWARSSKRLVRMGKSDTVSPIAADGAWSGNIRDKQKWFRIAPGTTRTVQRRLVLGSGMDEARMLAGFSLRNPTGFAGPAIGGTQVARRADKPVTAPAMATQPGQVVVTPPQPEAVIVPGPVVVPGPQPEAPPKIEYRDSPALVTVPTDAGTPSGSGLVAVPTDAGTPSGSGLVTVPTDPPRPTPIRPTATKAAPKSAPKAEAKDEAKAAPKGEKKEGELIAIPTDDAPRILPPSIKDIEKIEAPVK